MEAAVFERMAELDESHWWFVGRRRILEQLIRRVIRPPAGARILEIGCGTGHNLAMLGRFGAVEATELNDSARAIASARLGRPVARAALPDLSMVPDERFDLIALLDVLEHVADDVAALHSIRPKLRPAGKLLVTVPGNPWMWSAHDVSHHHHRRYRRRELESVARAAGLEVDLLTPFNSLLFPAIAAARLAGRVLGRDSADDAMPPRPVNRLLRAIFAMEAPLIGRIPFPFGVSLVAVLRRPD